MQRNMTEDFVWVDLQTKACAIKNHELTCHTGSDLLLLHADIKWHIAQILWQEARRIGSVLFVL